MDVSISLPAAGATTEKMNGQIAAQIKSQAPGSGTKLPMYEQIAGQIRSQALGAGGGCR